ncbi:hypothetical protein V9T40_007164 [Parthenolecanium corni]|uniref:CCHC-type domain-containing protein n=1 Tax=Parthenolecanium corni TaxID=536013 RepID=A0AAN9TVV4_9HEMI
MVGGVVKRSAVRRTSVSEMASKIKTPYMAGPLLQRTSPRPAERMSPKESPKGRGPEARKLMDKLADEIQDSLTKLFNKKQGPPSPSQPRPAPLTRLERRPPVGKHPAERMMESGPPICFNCGRRSHRTEECLLPDGKGKRCYNCLKLATHSAKDCRAPQANMSDAIRASRGVSRGRGPGSSRMSSRPMRSRSSPSPSPPSPRRGFPSMRGRSSIRGRSYFRGGPSGSRSSPKRFLPRNPDRGPTKPSRVAVPTCRVCGNRGHPSHECTKRKSSCHVCKKTGHLAAVCRFR